ncbi:type VI-B CRISPR accessory protein Csx28 [Wenyingzhuangia sp. IMCC45574]
MELETKITVALLSAITSILISGIGWFFGFKKIRKEKIEEFKKEHYSRLIDSHTEFWKLFRFLSTKYGEVSIVKKGADGNWILIVANVRIFLQEFNDFFYSEKGIYLNKELRTSVFKIRDNLLIKTKGIQEGEIPVSNNEFKKFKELRDQTVVLTRECIGLRNTKKLPTEFL